jgi:hypothetical protein
MPDDHTVRVWSDESPGFCGTGRSAVVLSTVVDLLVKGVTLPVVDGGLEIAVVRAAVAIGRVTTVAPWADVVRPGGGSTAVR